MRIRAFLQKLRQDFNYRTLPQLKHDGNFVIKEGKKLLNLASNDYLNLAYNENLKKEFLQKISKDDLYFSASSSRSLSGNFSIYTAFENYLKSFFKDREILHFNSGYHCNIACISALATLPKTLFLCDKLAHASMIDGLRLGGAKFLRFKHNDMQNLELLLEKHHKDYENIIILSEALFSMDGDFARLKELIRLKKRFSGVYLYIDEAHSVGCFGNGLGLAVEFKLSEEIDFLIFTFGKALASMGACIITKGEMKEFFTNTARSLIYSTALAPINVAWSLFIFQKMKEFEEKRKQLFTLAKDFKKELKKRAEILGEAYIISLILRDNEKTLQFATKLEENGFFAPAIKSPTVPPNTARIRFSIHSGLKIDDLSRILELL